ncbi:tail assembly chaperone [Arthrobacter phage Shambre1]|uniref:Tail assembly chaperone n=1 Tax=Arthrobacter phage Shambre1 TaxID=2927284 RepID=A0A977PR28_9CAUD|nr:tail assembly chaperone [Arthrobacter phage Shambre1]UXE04752.1 tail assembly chaperone [Arthrobacter phage Shambre1]
MSEQPEPTTAVEKVGAGRAAARPTAATRKRPSRAKGAVPAGAKKPEDHQSAKTDVAGLKTVVVEYGQDADGNPYTYSIEPEAFDDLEFVDAMIALEGSTDEAQRTVAAYQGLKQLLGPEGMELYKTRARDPKTGRVSFSGMIPFFNEVMKASKQGNS